MRPVIKPSCCIACIKHSRGCVALHCLVLCCACSCSRAHASLQHELLMPHMIGSLMSCVALDQPNAGLSCHPFWKTTGIALAGRQSRHAPLAVFSAGIRQPSKPALQSEHESIRMLAILPPGQSCTWQIRPGQAGTQVPNQGMQPSARGPHLQLLGVDPAPWAAVAFQHHHLHALGSQLPSRRQACTQHALSMGL